MAPTVTTPATKHAIAKAATEPTRTRILQLLDGRPASASDVARELGENLPKVHHHFIVLSKVGLIRKTRTEQRGATVATIYTSSGWLDRLRGSLPPELFADD